MRARVWAAENMETQLEEAMDACIADGPQIIAARDEPKVILVSYEEWENLQKRAARETK